MTHPGGPLTALAYELVIGTPQFFHCGKQIASYVGAGSVSYRDRLRVQFIEVVHDFCRGERLPHLPVRFR